MSDIEETTTILLHEKLIRKIADGENLFKRAVSMQGKIANGLNKLENRIKAEIRFLEKISKDTASAKKEHIDCSNLGQLTCLIDYAASVNDVTGVLQSFTYDTKKRIVVDVVSDGGSKWNKIILRNPKALHELFVFGGRKGNRSLDKVAKDFLECAKLHPVMFIPPQINFVFLSGVSDSLIKCLKRLGVSIEGEVIPDCDLGTLQIASDSDEESEEDSSFSNYEEYTIENHHPLLNSNCCKCEEMVNNDHIDLVQIPDNSCRCLENINDMSIYNDKDHSNKESLFCDKQNIKSKSCLSCLKQSTESCCCTTGEGLSNIPDQSKGSHSRVNIDVTCMIAHVSATANGGCNFVFKDQVLTDQAECERNNPVKDVIEEYFKGHELFVCQEAVEHFRGILLTIGGPGEKQRGERLIARLTVVPAIETFQEILHVGGKVKELSRKIFGTGEALKAVTITSNRGFVRSAQNKGIVLAVKYHEARALTEMKELTAEPYKSMNQSTPCITAEKEQTISIPL